MNVSGYGLADLIIQSTSVSSCPRDALFSTFSYPIHGLYTNNASAPLHSRAGLRKVYKFGLYSHCAYVSSTAALCADDTIAYQFQPCTVITSDMLSNYSDYTNTILRNATFANSSLLARSSRAAYYLLLLGTILTIISLVTSVRFCPLIFGLDSLAFVPTSTPIRFICKHTGMLFLSASAMPVLAIISGFAGSAIWTAIINKAKDVNSWTVQPAQHPLGIEVSAGTGFYCAWVAFALLAAANAIDPTIECASFLNLILTTPEP